MLFVYVGIEVARPHRVLVLKKKGNPMATEVLLKIVSWLRDRDISVMVEPTVYKELQVDTVTTWDESVSVKEDSDGCRNDMKLIVWLTL